MSSINDYNTSLILTTYYNNSLTLKLNHLNCQFSSHHHHILLKYYDNFIFVVVLINLRHYNNIVCVSHADRRSDDARASGADARAGRVRHGLRAGHRAHHGVADGHQFPEVRAGRRVHFAVRQRSGGHALSNRRPVLPLQEPKPAAPGPGHERPVDRQPVHRTCHLRAVLQAGRVLHHQAENDEQTATQDTAVLQEVLARLTMILRRL